MPILNRYDFSDRDQKFYQKLCGECKRWVDSGCRENNGERGYCPKLDDTTYRTDWCKLPEEVAKHEYTMEHYIGQTERGKEEWKPAS